MFGSLITWYLFLGGVSAGSALVALGVSWAARRRGGAWAALDAGAFRPLATAALIALAAGCACLMGDVRRPQMVHLLLTDPTLSVVNVGFWLLLVFGILLTALLARDFGVRGRAGRAGAAVGAATAVAAVAVAAYTGVYLCGFWTVPLWSSPLLVVLFVLSAASTGFGVWEAIGAFDVCRASAGDRAAGSLARIHVAIIAAEALCTVAMGTHELLMGVDPAVLGVLLAGELAAPFWLGFVGCGLCAPCVLSVLTCRGLLAPRAGRALLAVCTLVGGFFLRWCVVEAPAVTKAIILAGMG